MLDRTHLYFHVLLGDVPFLQVGLVILRGIVCLYVVVVVSAIARGTSVEAFLSILRRHESEETRCNFGHPYRRGSG